MSTDVAKIVANMHAGYRVHCKSAVKHGWNFFGSLPFRSKAHLKRQKVQQQANAGPARASSKQREEGIGCQALVMLVAPHICVLLEKDSPQLMKHMKASSCACTRSKDAGANARIGYLAGPCCVPAQACGLLTRRVAMSSLRRRQ